MTRRELVIGMLIATAFMGSGLITPLYELYQRAFGFSTITLTLVYAAYVLGNVAALLFFGKVSDSIGRRPVAVAAVVASVASALAFLFARETAWLVLGRVLSGLAVGLATSTGAAWLADSSEDKNRATILTNAANACGFAVGPLLGGILAQDGAAPLQAPFYVYLALLLLTLAFVARASETVERREVPLAQLLRPRIGVPAEIRLRFIAPAVTSFGVFAIVGFYAALIPTVLARDLHVHAPLAGGALVAELAALAGVVTVATRTVDERLAMRVALALLVPAAGLLLTAQALRSMPVLVAATALGAACWGLGIRGSLQVVNVIAPADRRAEVASAYYVAGFVGNSVPVIGIGLISAAASPLLASVAFGAMIALFAVAALIVERVQRRADGTDRS